VNGLRKVHLLFPRCQRERGLRRRLDGSRVERAGQSRGLPRNFGRQPAQLSVGGRVYADSPAGGPDWGLRAATTFFSPLAVSAFCKEIFA
jgi:hypothetical protein